METIKFDTFKILTDSLEFDIDDGSVKIQSDAPEALTNLVEYFVNLGHSMPQVGKLSLPEKIVEETIETIGLPVQGKKEVIEPVLEAIGVSEPKINEIVEKSDKREHLYHYDGGNINSMNEHGITVDFKYLNIYQDEIRNLYLSKSKTAPESKKWKNGPYQIRIPLDLIQNLVKQNNFVEFKFEKTFYYVNNLTKSKVNEIFDQLNGGQSESMSESPENPLVTIESAKIDNARKTGDVVEKEVEIVKVAEENSKIVEEVPVPVDDVSEKSKLLLQFDGSNITRTPVGSNKKSIKQYSHFDICSESHEIVLYFLSKRENPQKKWQNGLHKMRIPVSEIPNMIIRNFCLKFESNDWLYSVDNIQEDVYMKITEILGLEMTFENPSVNIDDVDVVDAKVGDVEVEKIEEILPDTMEEEVSNSVTKEKIFLFSYDNEHMHRTKKDGIVTNYRFFYIYEENGVRLCFLSSKRPLEGKKWSSSKTSISIRVDSIQDITQVKKTLGFRYNGELYEISELKTKDMTVIWDLLHFSEKQAGMKRKNEIEDPVSKKKKIEEESDESESDDDEVEQEDEISDDEDEGDENSDDQDEIIEEPEVDWTQKWTFIPEPKGPYRFHHRPRNIPFKRKQANPQRANKATLVDRDLIPETSLTLFNIHIYNAAAKARWQERIENGE